MEIVRLNGMNRGILVFVLGLMFVGFVFAGSVQSNSEILNQAKVEGKVNVIVTMEKDSPKRGFSTLSFEGDRIEEIKEGKEVVEFSSGGFATELSESELRTVLSDERVIGVEPVRSFHLHLSQVNEIVNSSASWNLQFNTLNLTGEKQTVCIIDTGVNFSHPDLLGKNLTCNINCVGVACSEDCGVADINGHGTHVAGIVAANGSIQGIAIGAKLIGVKVFPDSGGSPTTTEIMNAINWCVDNSELYNISVISMSLGTDTHYIESCDAEYPSFSSAIGNAYDKNISVTVSTGNEANYTAISSPACIGNAIPVGDTYDADVGGLGWGSPVVCTDATTALDQIVCHANRNSLVRLFAPGALINSTTKTGGYEERGGTSMATPIVAGAIAIMKELLNATNQQKTPAEIEDVLNDTGKIIYDAETGLYFSRINVYDAVLSLDNIGPNVTLVSPTNNLLNLTQNQTFVCNATDWQLRNVTLKIWNSSELYYNTSKTVTGNTSNQTSFSVTDIPLGRYNWNCEYYDVVGNFNVSSSNHTLTIGGVLTNLTFPTNNTYTKVNETNFTCNLTTEQNTNLTNVTFYLWNSTGLVNESIAPITGINVATNFTYNLTGETNYTWNCFAVNNNTNSSWADENYTIIFDATSTNISSVASSSVGASSAIISWTTGEASNSTVYYGTTVLTSSNSISSTYSTSHSVSLSGLSSSTIYYYNVSSCDRAGNCNTSTQSTFTTSTPDSGDLGGGGGGGGGGSKSYFPTSADLSGGYTKAIARGDKIYINLNGSVKHTVTVSALTPYYAEVQIQSDPIKVNLSIGKSKEINVSSKDYYDLLVTLNSIGDDKADITLKEIHKEINSITNLTDTEGNATYNLHNESIPYTTQDTFVPTSLYVWIGVIIALSAIAKIILIRLRNTNKLKEEEALDKYGKADKKIKIKAK
jgi:subtilisin family serine protease